MQHCKTGNGQGNYLILFVFASSKDLIYVTYMTGSSLVFFQLRTHSCPRPPPAHSNSPPKLLKGLPPHHTHTRCRRSIHPGLTCESLRRGYIKRKPPTFPFQVSEHIYSPPLAYLYGAPGASAKGAYSFTSLFCALPYTLNGPSDNTKASSKLLNGGDRPAPTMAAATKQQPRVPSSRVLHDTAQHNSRREIPCKRLPVKRDGFKRIQIDAVRGIRFELEENACQANVCPCSNI